MSTISFAYDPAVDWYTAYFSLFPAIVRAPATWEFSPGAGVSCTFAPDLSPAESAALSTAVADLSVMARFGVTMTLAEWQRVKPDASALKAYLGVAFADGRADGGGGEVDHPRPRGDRPVLAGGSTPGPIRKRHITGVIGSDMGY